MRYIEASGKTLEEAQRVALEQLGVDETEVEFEVLEKPGAFGLFGAYRVKATVIADEVAEDADAKPADCEQPEECDEVVTSERVKAREDEDDVEEMDDIEWAADEVDWTDAVMREVAIEAELVACDIASLMGATGVEVTVQQSGDREVTLVMSSDDPGFLIGRQGETLDALQLVVAIAANRGRDDGARVIVDAEDYRERRAQSLTEMAQEHAENAKQSGKEVVVPDLKAYERRLMHMALRDDKGVETYSEGEGRDRVLVISPVLMDDDEEGEE